MASRAEAIAGLEERQRGVEKRCEELEVKEVASKSRLEGIEGKLSHLEARGITKEVVEGIAATDVESVVDLLKRVKTAAESEVEEKKLPEIKQVTQGFINQNSVLEKKLEVTRQNVASWEGKLAEAKKKTKLYEESNLIIQDAFAGGYSPDALKGLFLLLHRFEVKGEPNASIKKLIRGFDGVKEQSEIDYRIRLQAAQLEQTTVDLAKVQGTMAAAVSSVHPDH